MVDAICDDIETNIDFLCAVRDGTTIQNFEKFKDRTLDLRNLPRTKLRAKIRMLEADLESNVKRKTKAEKISELRDAIHFKKSEIEDLTQPNGAMVPDKDSSDSEETVAGEVASKEITLRQLLEKPLGLLEKDLESKQKKERKLDGKNRWFVVGNKQRQLHKLRGEITAMSKEIATLNELLLESRKRSGMEFATCGELFLTTTCWKSF